MSGSAPVPQVEPAERDDYTREERFAFWLALDQRIRDGYEPAERERCWHQHYPETPEYRATLRLIDDYGAAAILGRWAEPGAAPRAREALREAAPAPVVAAMPARTPAEPERRRKPPPGAAHQRAWEAMRARQGAPWSTADIAAAARCVKRSATFYIRALRDCGYVTLREQVGTGGVSSATYVLARDTGPIAPMIRRAGGIYDRNLDQVVTPREAAQQRLSVVHGGIA